MAQALETPNRWLNNKQAAEYVGLSPSTMNKLRLSGHGPYYTKASAGRGPGGRILYAKNDLDAWLESQSRRSTSEDAPALQC